MFYVLGGHLGPTDKKFSSVNLCSRKLYASRGFQPESGHMAGTVLLLVHNIELDAILRLPLHVLEEALVDEHLEGAQHAGRKDQDEVALCGCKTAATANWSSSWCRDSPQEPRIETKSCSVTANLR